MYSVGIFYNKADATQFLLNVKDKGFTDAYVINQADLNDITKLKRTEPAFK